MIIYVTICEYSLSNVVIESIQFLNQSEYNRFNFEAYVIDKYGQSATYMVTEELNLKTKNVKSSDFKGYKYYFLDKT